MKIYHESVTPLLMRVTIKRQGENPERLTICECGQEECLEVLRNIVKASNADIFYPKATTVEVREYIDRKNGRIISFNFRGLSPVETKKLILKHITQ